MFLDNLQYRNYDDLSKLIHHADLQTYRDIDLVIGIPRSGMIPAYMIGLLLNLPVIDVESYINGLLPFVGNRVSHFNKDFRKVLVVDDSIKFGRQIKMIKDKFSSLNSIDFKYLSVFATSDSKSLVDYCLEIIDHPRVFQWNILNSWVYEYSCVDIDGVLCEDPSNEDNDDGENYLLFLKNVLPKYLPPCKIDVLVTSRLEKYRNQTEEWLCKYGVKYNHLEMLDLPDKETRIRLGAHATFKSKIYQKHINTPLFIESSKIQSLAIHSKTGKNVFCVENMTFYERRVNPNRNIMKRLWCNFRKV